MSTSLPTSCSSAVTSRRSRCGVAGGRGEAVGGALDGDGVQAEALGRGVPRLAALEELEGLGVGGEPLDGLGREHLDGGDDATRPGRGLRRLQAVGEPHDGDHERDVGLDRARRRRRSTGAPRRSARAGGCATRPAPGRARAPRRRRSGACRDPRCAGGRRRRTARRRGGRGARRWRRGADGRCHERVIGRGEAVLESGQESWHAALTAVSAARGPMVEAPAVSVYPRRDAVERSVDPRQGLVAPEQRDGLEDTG